MSGYNEEMKRDMFRDLAAKLHLSSRMAQVRCAFDADATTTETAADYCARMLSKLGLKASKDPVADLSMYLEGHDATARNGQRLAGSSMDSAVAPPWLDKYLTAEK
jgi:hypothetical protein